MGKKIKLSDITPHLYGFDENGNITDQMVKDWPEWEFIRDVFHRECNQYKTHKSDLQRLTEFMNTEGFECDVVKRYPFLKPNPENAYQKGYLVDPEDKVSHSDFIIETPKKTIYADLKYHKPGMAYLIDWDANITIYFTVGRPYEFCIKKTGQMGTLDQLEEVLKNGLN